MWWAVLISAFFFPQCSALFLLKNENPWGYILGWRKLRTWRQSRSLVSLGSGKGFAISSQKTRKQGDSREVCSVLVHVINYVVKASLRTYVSVPSVFRKQQNFLSGGLVSPAVLVLPYMLLKWLKEVAGGNAAQRRKSCTQESWQCVHSFPLPWEDSFPAVCVHTQRLELENPWMWQDYICTHMFWELLDWRQNPWAWHLFAL